MVMSPLAIFFEQNPGRRRIELARFAGITPSRVTQLCNGGKPGRVLAVRIASWTGDKVRPEDWDAPDWGGAQLVAGGEGARP